MQIVTERAPIDADIGRDGGRQRLGDGVRTSCRPPLQNMEAWVWTSATAWRCRRSWATSAAEASPWPSASRRTWPPLPWPGSPSTTPCS